MASPYFLAIQGNFVLPGYEPDGDSVRFIADDPDLYRSLQRAYRIKPSARDGSVQLRFDGIDATELHYGSAAQPLGKEARDVLLNMMGFSDVQFVGTSTKVASANPPTVPGTILTKMAEANGRPVSFVLLGAQAQAHNVQDGHWVHVTEAVLRDTLNVKMLQNGMAYYTVYTSMALTHRHTFQKLALEARKAKRGVWAVDTTAEFELTGINDINDTGTQVILPKLFRRSVDYLKDVAKGFEGNLADWIIKVSQLPSRNENDLVVVHGTTEVHLSDLLEQRNKFVAFNADILDIVFVEK